MVEKIHILNEIRRTAEENGGSALGKQRFQAQTGIKFSDWYGIYWARWNDALAEAGFGPNQLQSAYDDNFLMETLAAFVREKNKFPVTGELRMKARHDKTFPSHTVWSKYGGKQKLLERIIKFCQDHGGYDDVLKICLPLISPLRGPDNEKNAVSDAGYVYLIKSGRYYKIGRSNVIEKRVRQLAIQLPEKHNVVHTIRTDDPSGVEFYWHKRFAEKRKNGEWFELTTKDVSDFKRRKFM